VSRKWREIVVDTPELHCDIDFSRVNRARLMIRRAASSPVSIRFRTHKTRDLAAAREGVALIGSVSPVDIVALNVTGRDELLEQAVRCLCYGPAPVLHSIRFRRTGSSIFFTTSFDIFPTEALHRPFQSLVELSLDNCQINWGQIPSNAFPVLLKLDISFMGFAHAILNHTPKLRELSLTNVRLIYPLDFGSLESVVVLSFLRSLTLNGPLRETTYTLLELISFPELTKVDIMCSFEPREQNGMAAFLHHCGLRHQEDSSEFELNLDLDTLSIELSPAGRSFIMVIKAWAGTDPSPRLSQSQDDNSNHPLQVKDMSSPCLSLQITVREEFIDKLLGVLPDALSIPRLRHLFFFLQREGVDAYGWRSFFSNHPEIRCIDTNGDSVINVLRVLCLPAISRITDIDGTVPRSPSPVALPLPLPHISSLVITRCRFHSSAEKAMMKGLFRERRKEGLQIPAVTILDCADHFEMADCDRGGPEFLSELKEALGDAAMLVIEKE
jgi:hypothetical protein